MHRPLLAAWAASGVVAGELSDPFFGSPFCGFRELGCQAQQGAATAELAFLVTIGEEAEMADALEAVGEHVTQEPTDELLGFERRGLDLNREQAKP